MIYLDNAATTFPKPERVYHAIDNCLRTYGANPGRSGHKFALTAAREIYKTRELAADFFGIKDPLQIVFTSNATESLNLAMKGVLKDGDHVITTSMEHNSVIRPLNALQENGITYSIAKCNNMGMLEPQEIESAIWENTRMIAVTHASNVTGTEMPILDILEIAHKHKILVLLDASQTAGILEIDLHRYPVDLLAAPGHKGLLGPQGTGLLYIREGLDLTPLKEGGTGSKSEDLNQPETLPDRYESGTLNTPGIVGLGAGIEFVKSYRKGIYNHESELTQFFIDELEKISGVTIYGADNRNIKRVGVVSINVGDLTSTETSFLLDQEFDIYTRPGLHCAPLAHKTIGTLDRGTVRFGLGYKTTENEIILTLEAIRKILARRG